MGRGEASQGLKVPLPLAAPSLGCGSSFLGLAKAPVSPERTGQQCTPLSEVSPRRKVPPHSVFSTSISLATHGYKNLENVAFL